MSTGTGFKLLLAVSADGFLATGPDDNMKWTGKTDKAIFKLLTTTSGPLLAGSRTAAMMPQLPGRTVIPISRRPQHGISLQGAAWAHRDAWLIGGGEIALAALEANLVEQAYLCHSPQSIGGGIPFQPLRDLLGPMAFQVDIGGVVVEVFSEVQRRSRAI